MKIPQHLAIIMDGNGRWAQQRGLPRSAGHKAGYEHIPKVLEICFNLGIEVVSGFLWSTENWARPPGEVRFIMQSVERYLSRFVKELDDRNIRFQFSGSRANLKQKVLRSLDKAVAQTEQNGPHIFNMVFNYGGRAEIVHAARQLMVENSGAGTIAEAELESCLWTAGLPDVNLVLRTGGDKRISNFLLWKASDASVYVADNYWPAVTQQDIEEGIAAYNGRFGSVSQSV